MKALKYIRDILNVYKESIGNDLLDSKRVLHRSSFISSINTLRNYYPHLLYPLYPAESTDAEECKDLINEIIKHSKNNLYPLFPLNNKFVDLIGGDIVETPCFLDFKSLPDNVSDLRVFYSYFEGFMLSLMLSIPLEKIELHFALDKWILKSSPFYDNISSLLYDKCIIAPENEEEIEELISYLYKKIEIRKKKFGENYIEFCCRTNEIPEPYIFIVLAVGCKDLEFGNNLSTNYKKFLDLFSISSKYGIYFVLMNAESVTSPLNDMNIVNARFVRNLKKIKRESSKNFENLSINQQDITFGENHVKYIDSKYNIIYNKHGYDALGRYNELKSEYLKKMKKICDNSNSTYVCDNLNGNLPLNLLMVTSELEAKTIHEKLTILGASATIEKYEDLSLLKTPIIKCSNLFKNNCFVDECYKYINHRAGEAKEIRNKVLGDIIVSCIEYISEKNIKEIKAQNKLKKKWEEWSDVFISSLTTIVEFLTSDYTINTDDIIVSVGTSNDSEMIFRMDLISHVHAFILGQSGSGKSVFLHNIISSAIFKYAPEDLQLYLLDFKLGGVEFNRYKGVKHVKSLLVDNSDQQITLEILRELRDCMVERGKKLRDAGVNNLIEYNKLNQTNKMPQVLLVVDECHEMFKVGDYMPRIVSNEISEIVTKIAKEGRSQGVHLILATQTLSGTEISNEILNNISDHYLLKCSTVDSERMVERSSDITSKLSTGQIYYHHVDNQVTFQGYYKDKESAAHQIEKVKEKAKEHDSNGEYYFNGSQLFNLDKSVFNGSKKQKYPLAYIGKNISIKQNDISITLRKDYSENILLFGLNEQEQVTRTTMNVLLSLIYNTSCKDICFKVINCLSNEDSIYTEQLEMLEEKGYCEIVEGKKDRGCFLKQLAEDVLKGTSNDTILLILGQERFRELKMDMEIEEMQEQKNDDTFSFGNFSFGDTSSNSSVRSFKQALDIILDKGPEQGVHVVMQLDKPSNFLFSDYVSPKMVYQKFKHLIMLKSDESASAQLNLNDNIRLETLSRDMERLRAYYYAEESDSYTLFTPYMESTKDDILELFKSE